MKYKVTNEAVPTTPPSSVGHDDDQHVAVLMGEDLTMLKDIDDLEDGQPSGSVESLESKVVSDGEGCCQQGQQGCYPPCICRVMVDETTGSNRISIVFGSLERTKWLAYVIGLFDSASENDRIDLTICDCEVGHDVYSHRSLLSAIERCRATVITHAGFLTSLGDVAIWLAGDEIRWSKHMTAILVRQQIYGYGGDIRDMIGKGKDAEASFKEYRNYIAARGLFTKQELDQMYETRGLLGLSGRALEARMANLKQVAED